MLSILFCAINSQLTSFYLAKDHKQLNATLLKIDEDDIYELAIFEGGSVSEGAYLYTYKDGKVVSLSMGDSREFGDDGTFGYFEGCNCFYELYEDVYDEGTDINEFIYSIDNESVIVDHFTTQTAYKDETQNVYGIDGNLVTKEEYEAFDAEYLEKYGDYYHTVYYYICPEVNSEEDIAEALSKDYPDSFYEYMNSRKEMIAYKPVIYLYPETDSTIVNVSLDCDGYFTKLDPYFNTENGWEVIADSDGTIHLDDQSYEYLFWEAALNTEYSFESGFCVAGDETKAFLEKKLLECGLNEKEAAEFISYWLPKMESNTYNVISFQAEEYTDHAKLSVTPAPDTVIRVFMAWYSSDTYVELPVQKIQTPERTGFTVVEWGGSVLN